VVQITKVLIINRGNKKMAVCGKTPSFEASDCFVDKLAYVKFSMFGSKHIDITVLMAYWIYRDECMQRPLVVSIFIELL